MRIHFLIKGIRKNKNISLKKLSLLSGVSSTEINDIENDLKSPKMITLECIAKALKVKVKELYIVKR